MKSKKHQSLKPLTDGKDDFGQTKTSKRACQENKDAMDEDKAKNLILKVKWSRRCVKRTKWILQEQRIGQKLLQKMKMVENVQKSPYGVRKEELKGQHETNAKSREQTVKLLCMYEHQQFTHVEPTASLQVNTICLFRKCAVHVLVNAVESRNASFRLLFNYTN